MKSDTVLRTLPCILLICGLATGQALRWSYEYTWLGHDDAISIAYASDNTICTGGNSWDQYTSTDLILVAHDTLGNVLWGPIFYATENIDIMADMICGKDNIFYLCATVDIYDVLPNTDEDLLVSAISSGGALWNFKYTAGMAEARAIVQDHTGNICTCGTHIVYRFVPYYFINPEFLVLCFSNEGALRWRYLRENGGNTSEIHDCANSITIGGDNNIYAAGYISSAAGDIYMYRDFAVVKLDTSGQDQWTYLYDGPAGSADNANSIISDGAGKVFVAGSSVGIGTNSDFTVICIDTSGQEQWVYRYNGLANGIDEAYKIIKGSDNNLYIGGHSGSDFLVISLDTLGNERWIYQTLGGAATSLTFGQDRVYACEEGGSVVCLNAPLGNALWSYTYCSEANDIVYGLDNNIYAAGGDGTFFVVSLKDTTTLVTVQEEASSPLPEKSLHLTVTSPARNNLCFSISSQVAGNATLTIFNTIGQKIYSQKCTVHSGITKNSLPLSQDLPYGIYFLNVDMSGKSTVQKFVLVK